MPSAGFQSAGASTVRVCLLGPVEITVRGNVVSLPQTAKRVIMAGLTVAGGRPVSVRELIDTLWREEVTSRRIGNLQSHISQLRQRLRDVGAEAGLRILTQPPGYRLALIDASTDVDEMERLVGEARRAMRVGDTALAAQRYRESQRLWRGPAMADVAEVSARLQCWSQEFDERRLTVLDERVAAELALGLHGDLVGELTATVSRYPLRERPRCQLMLCLYRCGRRAEALACYQDARRLFADELGLDPSPELVRLQNMILKADPDLDLTAAPGGFASPSRPAELP